MGGIDQTRNIMIPLHRLQQEQHRRYEYSLIAPVTDDEQHQTGHHEKQQDISCREKGRIQSGESRQQDQPPQKPVSEILSLPAPVAALNVECKSEQQGENGIRLSREKTEHDIEHPMVQDIEPCGRILRIDRKYEMLHIVDQNNCHYREAAESVHNLYTGTFY